MQTAGEYLKHKYQNIVIHGADAFTLGGYTRIPNAILASDKLSDSAKMAYAILLSYAWQNDFCFPGQAEMGERWGKSERSVRRALDELEAAGFLEVKQQGLGRPNIYTLHITVDGRRVADKRKPKA